MKIKTRNKTINPYLANEKLRRAYVWEVHINLPLLFYRSVDGEIIDETETTTEGTPEETTSYYYYNY